MLYIIRNSRKVWRYSRSLHKQPRPYLPNAEEGLCNPTSTSKPLRMASPRCCALHPYASTAFIFKDLTRASKYLYKSWTRLQMT